MMKNRYDISDNIEDRYEPNSNKKVLKNLLGIVDPNEMADVEYEFLARAEKRAIIELRDDFQFTIEYIYRLHGDWLGEVYKWAGKARTVVISKAGITYCPPENIQEQMFRFEKEVLSKNTPCTYDTIEEIARAMSEVHGEFEIIHPFREGNGRIGRLIITLMAYQAGFAVESLDAYLKDNWSLYIEGLKEAWDRKHGMLTKLFIESLSHEEG